jgi:hypothetical protein
MKVVALTLALAFLLMATTRCDDESPPPPPAPDNYCAYLPTDEGNWWEYKVTVESMFNPREEYKLTLEIKETKDNYEGFPTAYVITVTKEGSSPGEIIVAPDGDDCYLERVAWAFLIGDAMDVGEWSQTGLVGDFPLEYVRDVEVKVPAQKDEFKCREYFLDNGNEFKPESWRELYAKGVGLVYYENNFKQYQIDPFELVDWRLVKYELKGYDVKEH